MPRPVLFVDHADALGGAERNLLLLMAGLDYDKWQPHLIAPPGWLSEEAAQMGIPVHRIALPRLRGSVRSLLDLWQGAARIANIARNIGAALIHSNTVRATAYTGLAARIASLPFVWHMQDFWLSEAEPTNKWTDRLGKFLFCRMATCVVANSHAVAEHLPCPAKLSILHNGIDLSHFAPAHSHITDKSDICRVARFPSDAPIVGMIGRVRPWKGQDTFLRMAGSTRRNRAGLSLPGGWRRPVSGG